MPTAYLSPSQLQDLTNVSSAAPVSGDNGKALVWNQTAGQWQAEQVAYSSLSGAPALPIPVASGGTGTETGSITGTGALTFTSGGTNQNINLNTTGNGRILSSSYGMAIIQPQANTNGFGLRIEKSGTHGFFAAQNGRGETNLFSGLFLGRSNRNGPSLTFMGWQGLEELNGTPVDNNEGVVTFSVRSQSGTAAINNAFKAFTFYNFGTQLIFINGDGSTRFNSTTPSTSTTTGAMQIAGGAGIAGAINVGGQIRGTATTASTSVATGALVTGGGAGIAGDLHVGGTINGLGAVQPGTPASPTAAGTQWQVRVDENYIYVCTQTGTGTEQDPAAWKRVAISTWTP